MSAAGSTGVNNDNNSSKKIKAVALLSGGLDSSLAVRMMLEQGVEVEALAIRTPFCDFDCGKGCGHRVKEVASELDVKLTTAYFGEEYLKMLKKPKHGYGSGMNPCIDCRAMMYNAAKEHMEKTGSEFVITGEVLFQRPMSQNNKALAIIESESNMEGKILRPLSAKWLPATDAEKNGLVNREELGDIKGRSRKPQLKLAEKYQIADPPNAAGGCLLTDPAFSKRVKDLFDHVIEGELPSLNDVELLKVGRHFRISDNCKLVVGRNKDENELLSALVIKGDITLMARDYVGPIGVLRGNASADLVATCASIVLRYSDAPKTDKSAIKIIATDGLNELNVHPYDAARVEMLRI